MEADTRRYKQEAAASLRTLRHRVQWKPGKALSHLEKRKSLRHLRAATSLREYNELIQSLVKEETNLVYLYRHGSERYYAVNGRIGSREWLLIATRAGVVETAFLPDAMEEYLQRRGFIAMGTVREVFA